MSPLRIEAHDRQRGFSLVEVSVVIVIISVLSVLITRAIGGLASSHAFTKGQAKIIALSERVVQDMSRDVRFAVRAYYETAEDRAFLDYLELGDDILPGSRLPLPSRRAVFDTDPVGANFTGNTLFVVTSLPTAVVDLSAGAAGTDLVRIDRHQFVLYYPTAREDGRIDLARWASRPVASQVDLLDIDDVQRRRSVAIALHGQGVLCAWHQNATAAMAFFEIDGTTGDLTVAGPPASNPPLVLRDAELSMTRMLQLSRAELAQNGSVSRVPVPKFAQPAPGFPHGFEVKVNGTGAGRLMLLRMVLSTQAGAGVKNSAEVSRILGLRDV